MIFTINALDNSYFTNGQPTGELENICFNSWKKHFNVKVFDFNSPEIKECKEKYKDYLSLCLKKKSLSCYSDVLRMYILSLYPNSLYFDTDVYLTNPERLNFNSVDWKTNGGFSLIYNGYKTDKAAEILTFYKNACSVIRDKEIIKIARLNYRQFYFEAPVGVHFPIFSPESPHFACLCNDIDKIPELYKKFKKYSVLEKTRLYFLTDNFDDYQKSRFVLDNPEILEHRKDLSKLSVTDRNKIIEIAMAHNHFTGIEGQFWN